MAETQHFSLKYFFYGMLVQDGKTVSRQPGVIASTPGITEGIVQECLRMAPLPPPAPNETTPEMPSALGLFRAGTTSYILAKSQFNEAGLPQVMYVLVPMENLRLMAGNVMALTNLAKMAMPAFATPKADLEPLKLLNEGLQDEEEQIVALCNLVFECQDSLENVEHIMSALVQGIPVAIINSPANLDLRLHFLQGLIDMIPHPAQIGVTYATHLNPEIPNPAQIKFSTASVTPERHFIYDWGNGKVVTPAPNDNYAHYIVSQLRLDPAMVTQQMSEFSRTMVWRARQQDSLSTALAWVSRRAAVDQAVREGQPADRETVAAILREDPTLPDDIRQRYARHVLAFALALDEPDTADVIPVAAAQYPAVADGVRELFESALQKGQTRLVYKMLERWIVNIKETSGFQWLALLHTAARYYFVSLLEKGEIQQAIYFLNFAQSADPAMQMSGTLGHLIEAAVPTAATNPSLTQTLFVTAVEHLPAGQLQSLLSNPSFTAQLPSEARTTIEHLKNASETPAPPNILMIGAGVFEVRARSLVLARFIEWAAFQNRLDLLDSSTISALLELAKSEHGQHFASMITQVAGDLADSSVLNSLDVAGQRALIQLLMQTQQPDRAIGILEYYQNTVYGTAKLREFTQLAGDAFRLPNLPATALTTALEMLDNSQVRIEPRTQIYLGVLESGQWNAEFEYAARRLTGALFNDYKLMRLIGAQNALRLLDFYYRLRNPLDALRVAASLTDFLLDKPKEGSSLIAQMWPLITWDAETSEAATELLRRYIRRVDLSASPKLVAYFAKSIGPKTGQLLQATYVLRVALATSDLEQWAEDIHTTAQLFIDIAAIYHAEKELPPNHRLRRDLDTMTGGLSAEERRQVAQNMEMITRQIFDLGNGRTQKRGRTSIEEQFVQGLVSPQSGVDLLRFIGGHFANHKPFPLELEREAMMHIFGNRSASMFLQETTSIRIILTGLQTAFTIEEAQTLKPDAIIGELESLWNTLSLYNQRRLQKQLAKDCQQLAEVISSMADRGSEKIFASKGLGQQLETGQRQPRASLETMRWIAGYFAYKHK